jgi:hypothetical protein
LVLLLLSWFALPAHAAADPVVFSFVFVGCNRLDKAGADATGSLSTANAAQLLRDFKDISKLQPSPQYVILAGDIVKAKKKGTKTLKKQLDAWVALAGKRLDPKTTLLAFTGNHELLRSVTDAAGEEVEVPNQPAYPYWQEQMKKFIGGKDGPPQAGPDQLVNDEARLSYTFQSGPYFFMVLNTDTQIDQTTSGDIPLNWIEAKLSAAQQDPSVRHIFVMGHKPIAVPGKSIDDGASNIRKSQGQAFYALLNKPAAGAASSKVRAYLSAHAHQWNYQPDLAGSGFAGKIPQIIAGNGGSPPDKTWRGPDAYFGYTLIAVTQSGTVSAQSFGRAIPAPDYYAQKPAPLAATLRGSEQRLYPAPGQ